MPDDLLRFVIGPAPMSSTWVWVAVLLTLLVIGWYIAVFLTTMPPERNAGPRLVASARAALVRRRFAREARRIDERRRSGELPDAAAGAELSRTLREFLHEFTGVRAQYMQVEEVAKGSLAPAAPILARLNDVAFNERSAEDVGELSGATEELILTWS